MTWGEIENIVHIVYMLQSIMWPCMYYINLGHIVKLFCTSIT